MFSPAHSTQVVPPHSPPPHAVVFVQRLHAFGSARLSCVQFGDTIGFNAMSKQVVVPGSHTVQQPKQSQPGGFAKRRG